ncbi:MAG: polyisoprenoid-binding protein [Bacteroidetes bacterium]|nr:MAG: polyisoprenoid-binding protein [Bacteroidota bacterium]
METNWKIDNMHSVIGFKVKHMMITNVSGTFGTFDASAITKGDDFNGASFDFNASIDSINTGVADRDAHLKSDDFFNAEQYPKLSFKSNSVDKNGDDVTVSGDLTIRDITLPVTLKGDFGGIVTDPYGQTKAGLTLEGKIKRSDFNLKWNAITEAGSIVVSDEIRIQTEIQFIKEA